MIIHTVRPQRQQAIDFRSSLYLGLHHPADNLIGWSSLTTGSPAIVELTPTTKLVVEKLRRWLQADGAILATSTLHAFIDVYHVLRDGPILVDAGAYPLATLASSNRTIRHFPHYDPEGLAHQLRVAPRTSAVVTDGWCILCGRPAPLADYARIVSRHDATLIVDDTQAVGVLGTNGRGTVTIPREVTSPIVTIASCAKGLGVPVTAITGPRRLIERINHHGPTRTHSSQPSAAHIAALNNALDTNNSVGDHLRSRLWKRVRRFRSGLAESPLLHRPIRFPVIMMNPLPQLSAAQTSTRLERRGIQTLVLDDHGTQRVGFVIRADHRLADIDTATRTVRASAAIS